MSIRVYISGPMRGYPELNVPAFREAATRLAASGCEVVSPVDVCAHMGDGCRPEEYLRVDLAALLTCNAMTLLPGWERSTGARCEATVAVSLGFQFVNCYGEPCAAPRGIAIPGGYDLPFRAAEAGAREVGT